MPLHLPPITRRRFLASSLAVGAGLRTTHLSWAAQQGVDADRWALMADSHVAANAATVSRGVNMSDNLARVVREIAALAPKPVGAILDGDAAYTRGEVEDYTQVARLLRPLGEASIPVHVTLGNHDHRENFRAGLVRESGRPPLASRHVAVVEASKANWFVLDSLDRVNATPGNIGAEQLDWLTRVLDARADKPALVVVHHDLQWTSGNRSGLVDTERLFTALVQRRQVKAVFYGHTHRWSRARREDIHLINLPPVGYVFTQGMPSGWVELRLRERAAVMTLHALDANHRLNNETVELAWR